MDFGTKRLGLALAEEGVVQPFEVWKRQDLLQDLGHLARVVEDYSIEEVVVGVPTQLDGTVTPATERARAFAQMLRVELSVPITEWDEALSSFEADQRMTEAEIPPRDRKERRDAFAAMIILEDYMS
ncbi:MAG: Holliday junction resolvase RuvX [Myxococcota bacterium]